MNVTALFYRLMTLVFAAKYNTAGYLCWCKPPYKRV